MFSIDPFLWFTPIFAGVFVGVSREVVDDPDLRWWTRYSFVVWLTAILNNVVYSAMLALYASGTTNWIVLPLLPVLLLLMSMPFAAVIGLPIAAIGCETTRLVRSLWMRPHPVPKSEAIQQLDLPTAIVAKSTLERRESPRPVLTNGKLQAGALVGAVLGAIVGGSLSFWRVGDPTESLIRAIFIGAPLGAVMGIMAVVFSHPED